MCGRYELCFDYESLREHYQCSFPKNFEKYYQKQPLIKPNQPILTLKQEHKKHNYSFMLWGLLSEWSKDPLNSFRPYNARAETISEKPSFRSAWRHRRCLIPASGFFENKYKIRRKDPEIFWLAGIWNRWLGKEGSEIESCTIITTYANRLIKPLHNRMPSIIPNGLEDLWMQETDYQGLRELELIIKDWSSEGWIIENQSNKRSSSKQLELM